MCWLVRSGSISPSTATQLQLNCNSAATRLCCTCSWIFGFYLGIWVQVLLVFFLCGGTWVFQFLGIFVLRFLGFRYYDRFGKFLYLGDFGKDLTFFGADFLDWALLLVLWGWLWTSLGIFSSTLLEDLLGFVNFPGLYHFSPTFT